METGLKKPDNALSICGSKLWFNQVQIMTRAGSLGFRNEEKFPSSFFLVRLNHCNESVI